MTSVFSRVKCEVAVWAAPDRARDVDWSQEGHPEQDRLLVAHGRTGQAQKPEATKDTKEVKSLKAEAKDPEPAKDAKDAKEKPKDAKAAKPKENKLSKFLLATESEITSHLQVRTEL